MKLLSKHSGITINLSTEAVVRVVVIAGLTFLGFRLLGRVDHQLKLVAASAFLAIALNPAVGWITRKLHIKSRILATGIAYFVVMGLLIGFLALVAPPLVKQSVKFIKDVPRVVSQAKQNNDSVGRFIQDYHIDDQIDQFSQDISNNFGDIPNTLWGLVSWVGGTLASVITVLVLTFMMLVEAPLWIEHLWRAFPVEKRAHHKKITKQMYQVVTGYVNGQVLIAAIAASFAILALLIASQILNVSVNILAFAAIVFVFGLIPLIGNTLAAIIVVAACLFVSWPLAIVMAVFFPVYQQIENATLTPHIQSKGTQLTPLLVFIAALMGAGLGGLLGAFAAIPVAGCIRVIVEDKFKYLFPDQEEVETLETE